MDHVCAGVHGRRLRPAESTDHRGAADDVRDHSVAGREVEAACQYLYTVEEVAEILAPLHPLYRLSESPPTAATTVSQIDSRFSQWEESHFNQLGNFCGLTNACWARLTGDSATLDAIENVPPERLTGSPPPLSPQIIQLAEQYWRAGRVVSASTAPLFGLSAYAIRFIVRFAFIAEESWASSLLANPQLHYLRCLLDADAPRQVHYELQEVQKLGNREGGEGALSWAPASDTDGLVRLWGRVFTPLRQQQWSRKPDCIGSLELTMLKPGWLLTERPSAHPASVSHHLCCGPYGLHPRVLLTLQAEQTAESSVETLVCVDPEEDDRPVLLARIMALLRLRDCRLRLVELVDWKATDAEFAPLFDALTTALPTHPLQQLLLSGNHLRNIPLDFQMRGWPGLSEIDLSNNKTLLSPAYDLVNTSARALHYFSDLTSDTPQRVSKLRLMVTGFGGVGQ